MMHGNQYWRWLVAGWARRGVGLLCGGSAGETWLRWVWGVGGNRLDVVIRMASFDYGASERVARSWCNKKAADILYVMVDAAQDGSKKSPS